jgi:hypothetical protein
MSTSHMIPRARSISIEAGFPVQRSPYAPPYEIAPKMDAYGQVLMSPKGPDGHLSGDFMNTPYGSPMVQYSPSMVYVYDQSNGPHNQPRGNDFAATAVNRRLINRLPVRALGRVPRHNGAGGNVTNTGNNGNAGTAGSPPNPNERPVVVTKVDDECQTCDGTEDEVPISAEGADITGTRAGVITEFQSYIFVPATTLWSSMVYMTIGTSLLLFSTPIDSKRAILRSLLPNWIYTYLYERSIIDVALQLSLPVLSNLLPILALSSILPHEDLCELIRSLPEECSYFCRAGMIHLLPPYLQSILSLEATTDSATRANINSSMDMDVNTDSSLDLDRPSLSSFSWIGWNARDDTDFSSASGMTFYPPQSVHEETSDTSTLSAVHGVNQSEPFRTDPLVGSRYHYAASRPSPTDGQRSCRTESRQFGSGSYFSDRVIALTVKNIARIMHEVTDIVSSCIVTTIYNTLSMGYLSASTLASVFACNTTYLLLCSDIPSLVTTDKLTGAIEGPVSAFLSLMPDFPHFTSTGSIGMSSAGNTLHTYNKGAVWPLYGMVVSPFVMAQQLHRRNRRNLQAVATVLCVASCVALLARAVCRAHQSLRQRDESGDDSRRRRHGSRSSSSSNNNNNNNDNNNNSSSVSDNTSSSNDDDGDGDEPRSVQHVCPPPPDKEACTTLFMYELVKAVMQSTSGRLSDSTHTADNGRLRSMQRGLSSRLLALLSLKDTIVAHVHRNFFMCNIVVISTTLAAIFAYRLRASLKSYQWMVRVVADKLLVYYQGGA